MIPITSPPIDTHVLSRNLFERYTYESYADSTIKIDPVSHIMGINLYYAYIRLLLSLPENETNEKRKICEELAKRLLPNHFEPNESIVGVLERLCP